jgi:3-isopropylmalate dehydratase small subunit
MREDELATVAADDVLFPEVAFLLGKAAIVIGGQQFGIGTEIGTCSRESAAIGARRCGGAQVAGERFFKGSFAIVRRHGFLLS